MIKKYLWLIFVLITISLGALAQKAPTTASYDKIIAKQSLTLKTVLLTDIQQSLDTTLTSDNKVLSALALKNLLAGRYSVKDTISATGGHLIVWDIAPGTVNQIAANVDSNKLDSAIKQTASYRAVSSNTQISNTGNTTENIIYAGVIPGNAVGINGSYIIRCLFSCTSNTNTKTFKIKLNGNIIATSVISTSVPAQKTFTEISNRGSLSSQISGPSDSNINNGTFTSAIATYTIDTSQSITLTVTAQLGNSSDTMNLESIEVIANP